MCNPNPSTPGFLPTGSSWREETPGLLSRDLATATSPLQIGSPLHLNALPPAGAAL